VGRDRLEGEGKKCKEWTGWIGSSGERRSGRSGMDG